MPNPVNLTRPLQIRESEDGVIEIYQASGSLLLRYVYRPQTPNDESSRPYLHPLCTLSGECLTNFRPNDHRWHHGLSYTITTLNGNNFWGGPTYKQGSGYVFNNDHGSQKHIAWTEKSPYHLSHVVHWLSSSRELLLTEERSLEINVVSDSTWFLSWKSSFKNVSSSQLVLGNYYSSAQLKGSHYSGLQFRGARDLLDEHGDEKIGISAEGGLKGEESIHAQCVKWVEWSGQKDITQKRIRIRFEDNIKSFHAFIRKAQPLMAIPFEYDKAMRLDMNSTLHIDNTLTFTDL